MANYCFTRYAIEGKRETLNRLAEAVRHSDGYALNALEALQISLPEGEFEGLSRAEWHNAVVEEKEDAAVLLLEEAYVHDRGLILDWLMEQPEYAGSISGLYFLAQEEGGAFVETNDAEGRYFPEREIDGEKVAVVLNTPYSQRQWVTYTATINLPDGKEMKLDLRKKI